MKFTLLLTSLVPLLTPALAGNSWAGANNYFAFALPEADRIALLDGMQSAGMRVLRTFVTGVPAGQKTSDSIAVPDLEANGIGDYDDTVLDLIDQLMVGRNAVNPRYNAGMHDGEHLNALTSPSPDIYGSTYGTEGFYTDAAAINSFNQRITHIVSTHKNSLLGNQPWSNLSAYIFGLEPQNEPMVFDQSFYTSHLSWICNAAQQIRNNVSDPNQLIFTGGGSAAASVQSTFFQSSCAIDVVAIHDYTSAFDSYLPSAISQAQAAGKKLIIEEWGSLVGSGRTANLDANVQKINNYQVPWLYWELISNPDPHQGQDYEIQINGTDWSTIAGLAEPTAELSASPFDFSASLRL
ncbi:glycoside hydrolase family 5 protein [Mycena galericulata]|nr:glycoside hydrolase family 5 protein [Mycena galericulata]